MNPPRQILALALTAAAEAFCCAAEAANSAASLLRGELPPTEAPEGERCEGCGEIHGPGGGATALLGLLAAQRNRPEPEPGPSTVGREWSAVFADKVRAEDLIAVDGPGLGREDLGLRALRVKEIRRRDHQGILGSTVGVIVLLLQDEDSGEPATATVTEDAPLRVAALAPDSVPADLGGAS
jgi:hypothetical protein